MNQSNDNVDYSNQKLTEFPIIAKQNLVIQINLKNNKLLNLPNLSNFTVLRTLDISRNRFIDLSPVSAITSLRVLDCSENRIVSLGFVAPLVNLEILRASHNRISTVAIQMPESLIDVDLSNNEIVSLDFLQHKFPLTLQRLDISSNLVSEVISLRVIAVFTHLHTLNVGLLESNRDINLLALVKHLCPSLVLFDGVECPEEMPPNFPNPDHLLDVLVRGNESELRSLIQNNETKITWDEPQFIPFNEETPPSPILSLEKQIEKLEKKLPILSKKVENSSPSKKAIIQQMYRDINELKSQISVISNMIYFHDKAMKEILPQ